MFPVCSSIHSKAAPIEYIFRSYKRNLSLGSQARRFTAETKACGFALHALIGPSAYQKLSVFFSGGVPGLRTVQKLRTNVAPALDGFSVLQAARMWAYFTAMIKLTEKLDSIATAEARLRSRPFVSIAEDATSIRPTVSYNSEFDQVNQNLWFFSYFPRQSDLCTTTSGRDFISIQKQLYPPCSIPLASK